jgi:hypothetical protein
MKHADNESPKRAIPASERRGHPRAAILALEVVRTVDAHDPFHRAAYEYLFNHLQGGSAKHD